MCQITHGLGRYLRLVAPCQDVRSGQSRRETGDRLIEFGLGLDPQLRGRKVLLTQEIRLVEQGEYPFPCIIGIGNDADPAIGGRKGLAVRIDLPGIAGRAIRRIESQPPPGARAA